MYFGSKKMRGNCQFSSTFNINADDVPKMTVIFILNKNTKYGTKPKRKWRKRMVFFCLKFKFSEVHSLIQTFHTIP